MLNNLKKSVQNCRIGKKHKKYVFTRVSDQEFDVNGVRVFKHMDGNWSSNPAVDDYQLKQEVTKFFNRLKNCKTEVVCSPSGGFANVETCGICGVVK